MKMLELRYRNDLQLVEVRLQQDQQLWPVIRSVFEENAEEINSEGAYSLFLPVWAFLSCRHGLAYTLTKLGIVPDVDQQIKGFLQASAERDKYYKEAPHTNRIDPDRLISVLRVKGFTRSLTQHQIRNVSQLVSLPSAATFSVPGAGKTTEALAFYYFKKGPANRLLVVSPKNAFAAWEEQLKLCIADPPQITRLVGGEKVIREYLNSDAEIFLITYQQLWIVRTLLADFMLGQPTFMFLDESHHIKRGSNGQWSSTVLSLAHLPIAKLIMTGTPLPNSLSDLIPQLNFIYPEIDATEKTVEKLIKPLFVRTTKEELRLPKYTSTLTPINLRPAQRNLYELLRSEEARQFVNISARDRNALRRIGKSVMRLLQLVSNPALLARQGIDLPDELYETLQEGDSPKIEYACTRARKLAKKGHKVVIWSGFIENVELISARLSDIGADFIHGGVEAGSEEEENTRERKLSRFRSDENAFVLVANPAACAEGISLHTTCHYAIYVDRNYNAAQYLQSVDRIHRLGLPPEAVTAMEILYSPDTIDESVARRLDAKIQRMARVLNDPSLHVEYVEPDLESDEVMLDDAIDFLNHLNRN